MKKCCFYKSWAWVGGCDSSCGSGGNEGWRLRFNNEDDGFGGVLLSRLHDLKNVFLDQPMVIKLVGSCPSVLTGDWVNDVLKVVMELKTYGIENGWFIEHLCEEDSYDSKHMLELLCLLKKLGCSNKHLEELLHKHPTILFRINRVRIISYLKLIWTLRALQSLFVLGSCCLKGGCFCC
ncbi:hypothetical protein Tco_0464877 [Tanacetum coccineum]